RGALGPRNALHELTGAQLSGAFVVDRDYKLLGSVVDEDLVKAQRAGATTIEDVVRTVVDPVQEDTPLVDLFAPSAESPVPLPVVDADGRFTGIIPRTELLGAMAPGGTASSASSPASGRNGDSGENGSDPEQPGDDSEATLSSGGTR